MISAKENMKRLYNHQMPEYLPIFGQGIKGVGVLGYREMPAIVDGEGYDWFGVHWLQQPGDIGPTPAPGCLLEDISNWRTVVKFPDLDAFDWAAAAQSDKVAEFDRDNNLMYQRLHNGLFERLQFLMGFENAMCALLTDPEEVGALLDAIVAYKLQLIDKIALYYQPDIIVYHDDWGTQQNLFIAPELWRSLFKERTRQIAAHVQSKGIKFEMHSCGHVRELVPELVEDLHVDSLNIMSLNDIPALKKITGGKVLYHVYINTQKYDAMEDSGLLTEAKLRAEVRDELMTYGAGGCYLPVPYMVRPQWLPIILDEYEQVKALSIRESEGR